MDQPNDWGCLTDEHVVRYLDCDLSIEEKQIADRHLLECLACQEHLALQIRLLGVGIEPEEEVQLKQIGVERLLDEAKALYREEVVRQSRLQSVRPRFSIIWRVAASLIAFLSISALSWFLLAPQPESPLEQGMQALKQAYTQERPLEPQLTGGFPYAPYRRQRGDGRPTVNQTWLTFAREKLTAALLEEETPQAHHMLGRLYALNQQYDKALEHLRRALEQAPDDPRLQSDAGLAQMELAARVRSAEALDQALKHFSRALELDHALSEALFNRALCYERMTRFVEAAADWQRYLETDPDSPWAEEARSHLQEIKAKKTLSKARFFGSI